LHLLFLTASLVAQLYCSSDRVQRLKDARAEAAKEIERYKSQKDAEFKKFESEVSLLSAQIL